MSDDRPDPDQLLAEVNRQESKQQRGKLKVFFGMSAGVGKTYAMLEEARKRAAEGVNVLIGYAEPHIRTETEALLLGLEILPYKIIEHRGAKLKEFDLDAAIAHKPELICVDELAHSNAAGMRHPKRWQDVAELLDAGINVYTTLNVQHLESVNDLVERITGVRVRETLPDSILEQADEVELVDIAPEELLERFREGKVYRPEQAEQASKHFFTKGNLIALREMALRKTAERVDAQMEDYRRDERVRHVIPASETILVCVGPSPLSARLIRSARRLAAGLRAKWIAAYVETPATGPLSDANRQRVEQNLRLAEELGATTVTLSGHDISDEILTYAAKHNVTKIVIGKPVASKWRDLVFGSVVDDLVRRSGEIDLYVIRGQADPEKPPPPAEIEPGSGKQQDWTGYLCAVVVVALTTAIGWPLYHNLDIHNTNVLMLYLLAVLWIAVRFSRGAAVLASVLSVVAFDLTFVPPYHAFSVSDQQYIVTFGVMLLTALVISTLTLRVRDQADAARQREKRTAALLALSKDLSIARSEEEIIASTGRHVADVLGQRAVVLLPDGKQRRLTLKSDSAGMTTLDEKESGVAQWAFEHDQPAGRGTTTLPAAEGVYVPLRAPRGVVGVLGVLANGSSESWSGERRQLIEAFASQAALAIERANLAEEARSAWERVEAEFLRNTLLSGVSHDLRTPLAAITGAVSTLIETGEKLSPVARAEMLDTICEQAERMERWVNNLLEMTRLEASAGGELAQNREVQHIQETIGSALRSLDKQLKGRTVTIRVPDDLPLAYIDDVAMLHVMVNLIQNAIDHTPPESPIDIMAYPSDSNVIIEVSDRGPGLPAGAESRVFEKFFHARTSSNGSSRGQGIGLGLAICKGLVEAHGGLITASNRPEGGASFRITLPSATTVPAPSRK